MKIHIICIAIIVLISTSVYAEDIPECNFDESMCPDCGTLTKAKITGSYSGYGTGPTLTCEYDIGTSPGQKSPDRMTFYYKCFKTAEEATIYIDYGKEEQKDGPPPFCTGDYCGLFGTYSAHCVGGGVHIGCSGNYYTADNIAAHMKLALIGKDILCNDCFKKIDEMSSCQKALKEAPEFKGIPIRLHIDDHPLKHLQVEIDGKKYTTDENGIVDVPENGEVKLWFRYVTDKEYFEIYVASMKKPLEFTLTIEDGIVKKTTVDTGLEVLNIEEEYKVEDFDFANLVVEEIYHTARRYVHIAEALEFYQDLGVEFDKPVDVVTFMHHGTTALYLDYKIYIDDIFCDSHEYSPFLEYHEFSHYAMNQMYGDEFYNELLKSPNHGGFANPTTTDSWIEGFAAFMPVVIANHYDRWWADYPLERRPSFYPLAGSLDANYKPWQKEGKAEEFAIAGFLWDYIDGESLDQGNVGWGVDLLYACVFGDFLGWDENEDKKLTAEEIYVGQIIGNYGSSGGFGSPDTVEWNYDMIKMGKEMEEYFDLEPDMELFERYDDGDGFLDKNELKKMGDILNAKDYNPVIDDWLKYYDDGDNKISREEAKHLLKGYEIIMEISKGKPISKRDDVVNWIKDERIIKYIDDNGMRPLKDEMSAREFSEYLLKQTAENDDDSMEWSFDVLWDVALSKKHKDFTSVLESLVDYSNDEKYLEAFTELEIIHGMYQREGLGNGVYDIGEAYTDSNKNRKWDQGEKYVDYPFSWNVQEGDILGAPSNYERIGRRSTPYFRGNYIKAPKGEYEITYIIKDGMKIIDIVGYTANSDGMLYVPVPPDSIVSVSSKDESIVFTSDLVEENFEEIIKRGYIAEIEKSNNYWIWIVTILICIAIVFYVRRKKK